MTNHVSLNAARAPRAPDETAQRNRHRSRKMQTGECDSAERDLAELAALLMNDLQRSPSPPIATGDADSEQLLVDRESAPRPAPRAWPRAAARKSEPAPAPRRPPRELKRHSTTETESRPGRPPEPRLALALHLLDDPPLLAARPRADRRSLVARVTGAAATVFSLLALVAVSVLLVMLAVGGERATPVAGQSAVAAESASDASLSAERVGAPVESGSIEAKRDASRIPSQGYSARAGGTVRAVDAQDASAQAPQSAETLSAENIPAASAAVAGERSAGAFAAQSVFSPPVAGQAPAARVAEESSATVPAAATENAGNSAGPSPETRSAPVTTHVNLRAGPENDAAVLAVVAAGRNVEVLKCTQWCEVAYDGRQGFIHRRFVSGAGG